ncbi:OLC1v1030930C1 [Oldenlandia corymbosa var. corymbosa]|uniref:OLC1v1030930C1 n=1 Tax=Oldenlandia corymbosa var. corymbosa TaxID=529605 RepID=A0AAV1CI21_OLDCO|nr:OLC1v1030930C1 [Oldenlandia corymbosa var. corymbosa]
MVYHYSVYYPKLFIEVIDVHVLHRGSTSEHHMEPRPSGWEHNELENEDFEGRADNVESDKEPDPANVSDSNASDLDESDSGASDTPVIEETGQFIFSDTGELDPRLVGRDPTAPVLWDGNLDKIGVGTCFRSKEELKSAITEWSLRKGVNYCKKESRERVWAVKCVTLDSKYPAERRHDTTCQWSMRAVRKVCKPYWEITKWVEDHNCGGTSIGSNSRNVSSTMIAKMIQPKIQTNPAYCVKSIQEGVLAYFKCKVNYDKAWNARRKAVDLVYERIIAKYPGSICHRYCILHVRSNLMEKYRFKGVQYWCWQMGTKLQPKKYNRARRAITEANEGAIKWLDKLDVYNAGNSVYMCMLQFLEDETICAQFSWGSAVLALLYRNLCTACKISKWEASGCLILLQLWAWERISTVRPERVPVNNFPPKECPYGTRWCVHRRVTKITAHNVRAYRDQLAELEDSMFNWMPYSDEVINYLPESCRAGKAIWTSMTPIVFFHIVEFHMPHRVMRQFGLDEKVPNTYLFQTENSHNTLHKLNRKGRPGTDWYTYHLEYITGWDNRLNNLVDSDNGEPTDLDYFEWYRSHTVSVISHPLCSNPPLSGFYGRNRIWGNVLGDINIQASKLAAQFEGTEHYTNYIDIANMALNALHLDGTEPAPSYPSHTLIEQDLSQIQPGHHPHRAEFKHRGGPMEGGGRQPRRPPKPKKQAQPHEIPTPFTPREAIFNFESRQFSHDFGQHSQEFNQQLSHDYNFGPTVEQDNDIDMGDEGSSAASHTSLSIGGHDGGLEDEVSPELGRGKRKKIFTKCRTRGHLNVDH